MQLTDVRKLAATVKDNISKVLVGIGDTVDLVLIALLCGGHVLLEDVPGVGKTMLAKCLARSLECGYKRIQFTPDLLPSDLTGINYFDQKRQEFVFRPGPVFTNIVLADEINRATPRTQSSLLECMEERQVTVDGEPRRLHSLFIVIATQNPVETRGTFPLPEAQLDRFFMRLRMGYPDPEEGMEILMRFKDRDPLAELETAADAGTVISAQKAVTSVKVTDASARYIIDIIEATRHDERITLGVSPRGSIALMKAAQVKAVLEGRDFITPDDIKQMAVPVLAHRMIIKGHAIFSDTENAEDTVRDILRKVPVPTEDILATEEI